MVLAFVVGTFGFNYQVTIALMARERVRPGRRGVRAALDLFAVGSLAGALLSTRRSVRPRQRFLVGSAVVFGAVHRRRRPDADVRSFTVLLVPTGAAAWCSAWPTTASCSSASSRRCAAASWRSTSCASWGHALSGRRSSAGSPSSSAQWGLILGGGVCVVARGVAAVWVLARGGRVRLEARRRHRGCSCAWSARRSGSTSPGCGPRRNWWPNGAPGQQSLSS